MERDGRVEDKLIVVEPFPRQVGGVDGRDFEAGGVSAEIVSEAHDVTLQLACPLVEANHR